MWLCQELYGIELFKDYPRIPELLCQYLGFRNRTSLLNYIAFYRPIIDFFFTASYKLKEPIGRFAATTGGFPNEKPLTFVFEFLSHLFFFQKRELFFCLHYDGYYELDMAHGRHRKLLSYPIAPTQRMKRRLAFWISWCHGEGFAYPGTFFVRWGVAPLKWCRSIWRGYKKWLKPKTQVIIQWRPGSRRS